MRATFSLFSPADTLIAAGANVQFWYEPTSDRLRFRESLIRFCSAVFVDVFADDLRCEAVCRTIAAVEGNYPFHDFSQQDGSVLRVTIESPLLELWTLVVRIEGDPTTDAWFGPFAALLSQCFAHTAFVCDDAAEYVISEVRGDDVGERLAFIIALAMHAEVPPGVRIQVVSDAPVAPSTAPRCIRCGRQFDDRDVRALNGLLTADAFRFAITCPEHAPTFASMPTEVAHAH